ncbi:hypothetical protein IQ06DRAFT_347212 [Phaeosphaeriaceae sp. SRC1lsM3a]|nr:hypothetical protein IQ06DRAFT_347212 [Stagonospora sp. SRC1lsM3a]
MYGSAQDSGGFGRGAKVAIPRLDRGPPPPPVPKPSARNRDDRVVRACKTCRRRKIKCTGDGPPCSSCQASALECTYEQARRDRLREAIEHNAALSALLHELRGRVDKNDQAKIDDALAKNDATFSQDSGLTQSSLGKHARRQSDSTEEASTAFGEAHITASAGSNEESDYLNENLSRTSESRKTGYFGQNSEVQWLSSVQRQTAQFESDPYGRPYGPPGSTQKAQKKRADALHERRDQASRNAEQVTQKYITDSTFYLDSDELKFDIVVDTDAIPQYDVAERLFLCYQDTVHPSFPLVPDDFTHEFYVYMNAKDGDAEFSPVWRAQLNLIFAIGAKFSHTIDADWAADTRDHLIYMKRAVNLLEMEDTLTIISGPNVPLVQTTGALAFYFLAIGHVSRAWITIGLSMRLALALGLHLRNENPKASASSKEILVRLWWTLNSIECLISSITGRPPVLAVEDATVPLPQSLTGSPTIITVEKSRELLERTFLEAPTSAQGAIDAQRSSLQSHKFLVDHVNLMRILQKGLTDIYSPRTGSQSWQAIQGSMSQLLKTLDIWNHSVAFDDFVASRREKRTGLDRLQRLLVMEYWSIKMVTTRPCLCRTERRIKNESSISAHFNASAAETCVESAMEMVRLFPDEADLKFIATCPWWATTHYIVQAIAVLLLETTYEKKDLGKTTPEKIVALRKMLRWLRCMEYSDPVAAKAYKVVQRLLKAVTPILKSIADELLAPDQDWNAPAPNVQHQHMENMYQNTSQVFSPNTQFQAGPSFANTTSEPQLFQGEVPGTMSAFPSDTVFDPEAFLQGSHGHVPASAYDNIMFPESDHGELIAIGTPFFTSFDQDAPFANLQDLGLDLLPSGNIDPNLTDLSNPMDDTGQGFDEDMDDADHPQN